MKKQFYYLLMGFWFCSLFLQCGGKESTENKRKTDSTTQEEATKNAEAKQESSEANPSSTDEPSAEDVKEDVIKNFAGTFSYPLASIVIKPQDNKNFDFELNSSMEGDCVWNKKGKAVLRSVSKGVHLFAYVLKKGDGKDYCGIHFSFDPQNPKKISVIRVGECQGFQEMCLSSQGDIWEKQN